MVALKIKNKNKNFNAWLKLFNKALALIIACIGIYFVFTVNDLSIKGFVLSDLKHEASRLEAEIKELDIRTIKLKSFENMSVRARELKMVKVDRIDYIEVVSSEVAKK